MWGYKRPCWHKNEFIYIMIIHMSRFLNMFYVIIMVNKEEVSWIVCAIVEVVSSLICVQLIC